MAVKLKIYLKDWLALKPYKIPVATDAYYFKMANEILNILESQKDATLLAHLKTNQLPLLALFLASYFEDIISETNIWNTFTTKHQEMYNKKLPFLNTSNYYDGEINTCDIQFLLWYYMSCFSLSEFITIEDDFCIQPAKKITTLLDNAFEFAPANKNLNPFYTVNKKEKDYNEVFKFCKILFQHTYLFYIDKGLDFKIKIDEVFKRHLKEFEFKLGFKQKAIEMLNSDFEIEFYENENARLLGFNNYQWAAEILGKKHPLYNDILNITSATFGYFIYKGSDVKNVYLSHFATSKIFAILKTAFLKNISFEPNHLNYIVHTRLIKWKNAWIPIGEITIEKNLRMDIDDEYKERSMKSVSAYFYKDPETFETLKRNKDLFLQFNNSMPIAFISKNIVDTFVDSYYAYKKNAIEDVDNKKNVPKWIEIGKKEEEIGDIVFYNINCGLESTMNVTNAFPLKQNTFYINNEALETIHLYQLLKDPDISTELALYCIENCKNNLALFKTTSGKIILAHLDFLLRFWKRHEYFTKPRLTYTFNHSLI